MRRNLATISAATTTRLRVRRHEAQRHPSCPDRARGLQPRAALRPADAGDAGALANVAAARAQYRVQRAAIFPQIEADGGITVSRSSAQGGSSSRIVSGNSGGVSSSTTGSTTTTYLLEGGTTAWEIDLFGRLRS